MPTNGHVYQPSRGVSLGTLVTFSGLVQQTGASSRTHKARNGQTDVPSCHQPSGIPDQYIELFWEALQTVPHKSAIVNELQKAMEAPPTKEAFRWALHDQKKTTTPGMSNISYGNIKDWPEELITHCYQLLSAM
jgi:hypothetical protein